MQLTKIALEAINNSTTRLKLAIALGVSENSVYRYIAKNDDTLTKAAAIQVIKEETGLTDNQILEEAESAKA